jgi:hypothetical protein
VCGLLVSQAENLFFVLIDRDKTDFRLLVKLNVRKRKRKRIEPDGHRSCVVPPGSIPLCSALDRGSSGKRLFSARHHLGRVYLG